MTDPPPGKERLNASPPSAAVRPVALRNAAAPAAEAPPPHASVPCSLCGSFCPAFSETRKKTQLSQLRRSRRGQAFVAATDKSMSMTASQFSALTFPDTARPPSSLSPALTAHGASVLPHCQSRMSNLPPTDKARRKTTKKRADLYREAGFRK